MGTAVLLIDDNSRLAWPLRQRLEQDGIDVSPVASAEDGVDHVKRGAFDVVVVGLPGGAGLRLCRDLKTVTPVSVCLLTPEASPGRIAEGFAAGADLVVGAPYDATELAARLRALVRRPRERWEHASEGNTTAEFELCLSDRSLYRDGKALTIPPEEFRLLAVLVEHAGTVVPHQRLIDEVGGFGRSSIYRLRRLIVSLRRRLEIDPRQPRVILTERGVGYRVPAAVFYFT